MKHVCVYCGSSGGENPGYVAMAGRLGSALAKRGIGLVFGGAGVGLMGAVADAALAGGGSACGIIPEAFANRVAHPGLTETHVVGSMAERKKLMFDLSDGFIALPGGLGTLDELSELLTWSQLGFHTKPCGLINQDGYYDSLLSFFDHAAATGFMHANHLELLLVSGDPEDLLDRMASYDPPIIDKWAKGSG
ncbi:MAG: TIGR00730 family Rossman fold protein [Gemmatimonadetes bacterium]|nr:TIGR00730 family Rossman fold protein [Gemmatimonadota bacterium]